MKFIDFFDRIYVLNLPQRVDRRRAIEQELTNVGMPPTSEKVEVVAAIKPEDPYPFQRLGSKGCFLSTLKILRQAKQQGLNHILILQDDLAFADYFQQYEEVLVEQLQHQEWDLVQFGYYPEPELPPQSEHFGTFQPFTGELIGAHFVGLNGRSIDRMICFLEGLLQRPQGHPDGGPMPIDGAFNVFPWQHPDIVRLISLPTFGYQRSSRSDVTPKWFDRLPVVRTALSQVRSLGLTDRLRQLLGTS